MIPLLISALGIAAFLDPLSRTDWIDPWRALVGFLVLLVSGVGAKRAGRRGFIYWLCGAIGAGLAASSFIPPTEAGDANEYLAGLLGVLLGGLCVVFGIIALIVNSRGALLDEQRRKSQEQP